MLSLADAHWSDLNTAYGSASNIPALLDAALSDPRPGGHRESSWFALWSALCHQGDAYTGSYAALPHLVRIAQARVPSAQLEPLLLAGCIELARLEGRGPAMPGDLSAPYHGAVEAAEQLAKGAMPEVSAPELRAGLRGAIAALAGDAIGARSIFESDGAPGAT